MALVNQCLKSLDLCMCLTSLMFLNNWWYKTSYIVCRTLRLDDDDGDYDDARGCATQACTDEILDVNLSIARFKMINIFPGVTFGFSVSWLDVIGVMHDLAKAFSYLQTVEAQFFPSPSRVSCHCQFTTVGQTTTCIGRNSAYAFANGFVFELSRSSMHSSALLHFLVDCTPNKPTVKCPFKKKTTDLIVRQSRRLPKSFW